MHIDNQPLTEMWVHRSCHQAGNYGLTQLKQSLAQYCVSYQNQTSRTLGTFGFFAKTQTKL